MASQKEIYRQWCASQPGIPVFSRDWWLDAACGEANWDVILVEDKGEIVASMPFYLKIRGGFRLMTMPPLTQKMGPYLVPASTLSHTEELSREKRIFREMIERLPCFDHFFIHFNHVHTNWLPFYWAGFRQMTNYTYIVPDLSDRDRVFANMAQAKKGDIKKARKSLTVGFDLGAAEFYAHHSTSLRKKGMTISYNFALFQRLYNAAYGHSAGRVIFAKDAAGCIHAALFFVWDGESAYHLISSIDPEQCSSGALSLLSYEAMAYLSDFTKRYDFEGSMVEAIEASYRKFGTTQTPYFAISKTPSRLLRARQALLDIFVCG